MDVVIHLCVCLYVYHCMVKDLYLYETAMYFSYIYYLIIIMLWGVS